MWRSLLSALAGNGAAQVSVNHVRKWCQKPLQMVLLHRTGHTHPAPRGKMSKAVLDLEE